MIDDKKIEKAARQISERVVDTKCFDDSNPTHLAFAEGHFDGFNAGAKWAINEFLKDLLHPNTEEPDKNKGDIITLVLITMLIHNLKNSFFGIRNLGDIRLADSKSSSGLIYLIYYQKILLIIDLIKRNSVW